jgi:hypothetical protein
VHRTSVTVRVLEVPSMRRWLLLCCLLALAVPAAAAAQVLDPPTVVTRSASPVGPTTATVHGTVDPNGQPTSYQFEYDTTTGYRYATAPMSAGSGTGAVSVSEDLTGLTDDTVYHFRIVAWPDAAPDQVVNGVDKTFHTLAPPFAGTNSTLDVASDSATLSGKLVPNGSPTTFYFRYGPTNAYGQQTPTVAVGQGTSMLYEQARIAGLVPNTTYHFQLVATNAAGTSYGQDRGFRTLRAPSGFAIAAPTLQVPYGRTALITGQVQGGGVAGIRLALASTPFPFRAPFTSTSAMVVAGADGSFRFRTLPIWTSTRVRVLTRTTPAVASSDITLLSTLLVTATATKLDARRVLVSGGIRPRLVGAGVALQRLSGTHWVTVRTTKTKRTPSGFVAYSLQATRGAHARDYRVMIRPRTREYAKTPSSTFTVPARPKKSKPKPKH